MLLAALTVHGCLAVGAASDRIVGGDLAPIWPALAAAAPRAVIAPAPGPGVRRVFGLAEIRRLAARFGVAPPEQGLCFERPVAPLDPARILETLKRILPGVRISLLDYGRAPVPEGDLQFSAARLRPSPGPQGALWTGAVRYAGTHGVPVWARVAVEVSARRVVAVVPLRYGVAIGKEDVRLETREEFPSAGDFAGSVDEVVGRVPRRTVPAGMPVRTVWLEAVRQVTRGETIEVEAWAGAAHLTVSARAEVSGDTGQTIPFRNSSTGRRFYARVEGRGRAAVRDGGHP